MPLLRGGGRTFGLVGDLFTKRYVAASDANSTAATTISNESSIWLVEIIQSNGPHVRLSEGLGCMYLEPLIEVHDLEHELRLLNFFSVN